MKLLFHPLDLSLHDVDHLGFLDVILRIVQDCDVLLDFHLASEHPIGLVVDVDINV